MVTLMGIKKMNNDARCAPGNGKLCLRRHQLQPALIFKRYQALRTFVPERQTETPQTLTKTDTVESLQNRDIGKAGSETIVGNPARQVMDMVDADITGEPA